jgi:hypothetical protein
MLNYNDFKVGESYFLIGRKLSVFIPIINSVFILPSNPILLEENEQILILEKKKMKHQSRSGRHAAKIAENIVVVLTLKRFCLAVLTEDDLRLFEDKPY